MALVLLDWSYCRHQLRNLHTFLSSKNNNSNKPKILNCQGLASKSIIIFIRMMVLQIQVLY